MLRNKAYVLYSVALLVTLIVTPILVSNSLYISNIVIFIGLTFPFIVLNKFEIEIYFLSFTINIVAVIILSNYFLIETGDFFTIRDSPDDTIFYNSVKDISDNWINGDYFYFNNYSHYSGYGYILLGLIIEIIFLDYGGIDLLTYNFINAVFGAFIPVLVYKLARFIDSENISININPYHTALFAAIYPTMVYYSSVGHRDIWIALFSLLFIYNIISINNGKIIISFLLIYIVYLFRPLSATYLILVFLAFIYLKYYYNLRSLNKYIFITFSLTIITLLYYIYFNYLFEIFEYEINAYSQRAFLASDETSLAIQLYFLPSPLSEISRFVYAAFTPIPPIREFRGDTLFLMFGHTVSYFVIFYSLFLAIFKYKYIRNDYNLYILYLYMLGLLFGIAMTSLDFRHKITLYPIAVILSSIYISSLSKKRFYNVTFNIVIALIILIIFYYSYKYII